MSIGGDSQVNISPRWRGDPVDTSVFLAFGGEHFRDVIVGFADTDHTVAPRGIEQCFDGF